MEIYEMSVHVLCPILLVPNCSRTVPVPAFESTSHPSSVPALSIRVQSSVVVEHWAVVACIAMSIMALMSSLGSMLTMHHIPLMS